MMIIRWMLGDAIACRLLLYNDK